MFNLFRSDNHIESIERIESSILNSDPFKYFLNNNSRLLIQYKHFEVSILSTALYYNLVKEKYKDSLNKLSQQIKKIYFERASQFLKSQILSGNLAWSLLDCGRRQTESQLILYVFVKFNKYVEESATSISENRPYWVEGIDEAVFDQELMRHIVGVKHYYQFIRNTLVSQIKESSDGVKYIDTIPVESLEEDEFMRISTFVEIIRAIRLK